ncbi:MAG: methylenetetrahydrofolate reductase [NAD(P)H] [Phycisphaerales bacterium]|nr:methylenetetrahydrofolate reductase [NAD(P)H] [Phycisphaerales bacterium]
MHIADIMARDRRTVSFEFFPPSSDQAAAALEQRLAAFAEFEPSFVSVTYGAGGSTRVNTHDLVVRLQDEGRLDPVPHLTCVAHDEAGIDDILQRYARHGISNILALRGDVPADGQAHAPEAFPHAADLVRHIDRFNQAGGHPDARGFGIGVAGFPEGHPETPNQLVHMEHLRQKVDAGADWITTQLFTDNSHFFDWRDRCDLAGITCPIIAGLMPITSLATMRRMADLAAGTTFPARLQKRLQRYQDDPAAIEQVGIQWAVEQCNDLLDQGVAGLHFYTLNRSDATRRIFEALGAGSSAVLRANDG